MLRVRPIILTSNFTQTVAQLRELGLSRLENDGDWAEFDSGNGKVVLRRASADNPSVESHSISLAFEVRDCEIFVRRTLEDGTHAEEAHTFTGPGARVTAPDGFSFELAASEDLRLPEPDAVPSAPSAVTAIWRTPDLGAANKVLADIGAKFVQENSDGGALFRAKNGGFVATAKGAVTGVELEIKHQGETLTFGAESES
ncbi:hypothetical protein AS189_00750 [Arthrobacter alpinus]|uniref:VOC domain-containing protein n=1 Tax=Arthrobacter alpinus TaxID=656366 RepID=A0A0S2LUY7_9MICC|nr:hypothetical protein [Arthrobacter alpinus]ALO65283.1 hypothetical protein AS189_00750 [Arthrobacter alpinus]